MPQINNREPSADGQLDLTLVAVDLTISKPDAIDNLTSAKVQGLQPCMDCGCTDRQIGPGAGPHVARLTCSECESFVRWVGKKELTAIDTLASMFGGVQNV